MRPRTLKQGSLIARTVALKHIFGGPEEEVFSRGGTISAGI